MLCGGLDAQADCYACYMSAAHVTLPPLPPPPRRPAALLQPKDKDMPCITPGCAGILSYGEGPNSNQYLADRTKELRRRREKEEAAAAGRELEEEGVEDYTQYAAPQYNSRDKRHHFKKGGAKAAAEEEVRAAPLFSSGV